MNTLWFWFQPDGWIAWVWAEGSAVIDKGAMEAHSFAQSKGYLEASTKILLLSNEDYYIRTLDLFEKKISHQKAQEVIPFMLEEDLVQELEEVQCFPLSMKKNQAVVSIFAKEVWANTVQTLQTLKIRPDRIIPASVLLPTWSCLAFDDLTLVNTPKVSFSAPADRVAPFLEQAVHQQQVKPTLYFFDELKSAWGAADQSWEKIESTWWASMAVQLSKIQHDMAELLESKQEKAEGESFVFYNLGFFVLLLILITFGFKWHHFQEVSESRELIQQQVDALYFKLYPQAKSVVAPKTRMERELTGTSEAHDKTFLLLLNKVAGVARKMEGLQIKTLNYEQKVLVFDVQSKDYATLQTFIDNLQNEVQVKQRKTTQQGDNVSAQIEVRG